VAVIEANRIAWRRVRAQYRLLVAPGYSESIDNLVERIGLDHTKELWALSEAGVSYVRDTINDTKMPGADPVDGWLKVSKTDDARAVGTYVERLRWLGAEVEAWPAERVRAHLPSQRYFRRGAFPARLPYPSAQFMRSGWLLRPKLKARAFSRTRRRSRSIRQACASVFQTPSALVRAHMW